MKIFIIIRFFSLLIISLYTFSKISGLTNIPKWKNLSAILFSLVMSIPLSYAPPLYELLFLSSCFIFLRCLTKINSSLLITSIFISTGISLGIEMLSYTVIHVLASLLNIYPEYFHDEIISLSIKEIELLDTVLSFSLLILSIVISFFFFRLKRLVKGFVFLENKKAVQIGIVFSLIIMIFRSFSSDVIYLLIGINLCTVGIHFWWQYQTTVLYKQRLVERDFKEKDTQIKKLTESNEFLAKTVHRDNKLIPAMYHAVHYFTNQEDVSFEAKKNGKNILAELDEIMQERKDVILKIQQDYKSLPSTEVTLIDYLLNHMFIKAKEEGIQFDVVVAGKIKNLIKDEIPKLKLETLLADLIENAMIAVSFSHYKKILLTMALIDDCYEIELFDSGIPFNAEILDNLGKKKMTTHADENGNGIGYLTIFDILKEVKASLIISESSQEDYRFTKSIKIRFDKRNDYKHPVKQADISF